MKRKLFLGVYLLIFSFAAAGCALTETVGQKVEKEEKQEDTSLAKKAIDQGKLALANEELEKAKSNFSLALSEDAKNIEAKQWVEIIGIYEQFNSAVNNKEVDKALKTLEELKANDKYALIEGFTKEPEKNLNILQEAIKELDVKIVALGDLYNPEDENSMPSEDYLYYINEIVSNPNVTAEQKKLVEEFENKATERANTIMARMEEEMRAAEAAEAQNNYSINDITAEEASNLITRLPSYSDLVSNGDTFAEPRVYENVWIIDVSRPNGLAEGSIIVDEHRTVSFMYPNGEIDEVTPY